MIPKKRIGNTLNVFIPVLTHGEPLSLEGRDITVILYDSLGSNQEIDFEVVDGNVVKFTYEGYDQRTSGVCRVVVFENYYKESQVVFDKEFVNLVKFSAQEEDGIDDLTSPNIVLEPGNLSFGGKSAYEIAVDKGFEGTVEEWLESLHGPKGDTPVISFEIDENGYLKVTSE